MKVYLIGFMGAGKTTIGRLLAERLGIAFYDLDQLIEAAQGRSVREIFEMAGETDFRRVERDLLQKTHFLGPSVIATGGGTFTFDENVFFIKNEGISVHLDVSFDVIAGRIMGKAPTRPLFRDVESASRLYQYRSRYYRMADHSIIVEADETPESVVARIIRELRDSGLHHSHSS